ncbi:DUF1345 domain-containing protein [Paragemmobacter straminiformis]|uniref:DUF1345 domain-containing protein n=1 Tax=Paragemmobacter straminiformis TaxID=2045119 RepID=A0A842I6C4_9RHOB|nr:DUF1345 domain-containing protein [Gemmobacter straminiformis]MBC2835176.1 DUF1345 domain-containing protein [Gemmobacter straminiformis]
MGIKHPRFLLFLVVALVAGAAARAVVPLEEAVVLGFDAGALVFLGSCLQLWLVDHPDAIRLREARDDGGRVLLALVALMVLASVLLALALMIRARNAIGGEVAAIILGTLVLAWLCANLVHAFHYANLYHAPPARQKPGGLRFPGGEVPLFADFCYFAFVIGMTSQVSDVAIESRPMRRLATLHGLQAFFFNLGVLALTINMLSQAL